MDTATTYFAPRTCTMVQEGEPKRYASKSASPLTDYADAGGYVLIAEPGAGETSAFKTEAARQGAVCATVRDFRTFEKAEWCGTTPLPGWARRGARGNRGWTDAARRHPGEAVRLRMPTRQVIPPVG